MRVASLLPVVLLALAGPGRAADAVNASSASLQARVTSVPLPSEAAATGAVLDLDARGQPRLRWEEQSRTRFSTFDFPARKWSAPGTLAPDQVAAFVKVGSNPWMPAGNAGTPLDALPGTFREAAVLLEGERMLGPSLATFADGSALIATQSTVDAIIHLVRLDAGKWSRLPMMTATQPAPAAGSLFLSTLGMGGQGTRLATAGPRVLLLWFDRGALHYANSSNAGLSFTIPERVAVTPGRVMADALLLPSGLQPVVWAEPDLGVYLKLLPFAGGAAPAPIRLLADQQRAFRAPRLVDGGTNPAGEQELLLALLGDRKLELHLVTLPAAGAMRSVEDGCGCDLTPEQEAGYPIRGRIAAIPAGKGALRVQHAALPGLLRAGETEFKAAPELLGAVAAGREILARIEQRGEEWWIFDVSFVMAAPTTR